MPPQRGLPDFLYSARRLLTRKWTSLRFSVSVERYSYSSADRLYRCSPWDSNSKSNASSSRGFSDLYTFGALRTHKYNYGIDNRHSHNERLWNGKSSARFA